MISKGKIKIYILPIVCIAFLTAIDQLSKFIIQGTFQLYESKPIIRDVFHITYIQNTGVAWGLFKGGRIIFLIVTLLALVFCGYIYMNISGSKKYKGVKVCLIFLVSGAIGNMIDRIKLAYVVDFLDFTWIDFPIFNIADIYVTCSMIVLIILCIFVYKNEDLDIILGSKETEEIEH